MQFGLQAYFKKIHYTGIENVPLDKPVILAANHTNALIDPVLVGGFFPTETHFITRGDVFNKYTEWLFDQLNMYPIYRARDGYHLMPKNEATFAKAFEILQAKGKIIIFAEGDCESHKQLRALRKGTARMAFQALEEFDTEVYIVPVGVNYTYPTQFRSEAMIHFSPAYSVKEFVEVRQQNKARGIKAFNKKLHTEMRANIIHLNDLENEELLEEVLPIIRSAEPEVQFPTLDTSPSNRLTAEQQAADYINQLAESPESEALNQFKARVLQLTQTLKKHNLHPSAIPTATAKPFQPFVTLLLLLFSPLYLLGVLLNGWSVLLAHSIAKRKVKQKIFISTFKWAVMTFVYAPIWIISTIILVITLKWWGLFFAGFLVLSAFGALAFADLAQQQIRRARFAWFQRQHPAIAKDIITNAKDINNNVKAGA